MSLVLFVSEDYLKEFSVINENSEMKQITPLIDKVQDQNILPVIGTGIFNELKEQIVAGTLTTLNKTLLDNYISKSIIWWVMYEAPLFFTYRFMNKGVMVKNSDNSRPIGSDEVNNLRGIFKSDAEFYTNKIVRYLVENSNSYPLYNNPGSGADTVFPKNYAYTNGMNLEDDSNVKRLDIDFGKRICC